MNRYIELNSKKKPVPVLSAGIKRKGHSRQSKSQGGQKTDTISCVSTRPDTEDQSLTKNSFSYHYAIGRGGFGRVWKVEMRRTKQVYAMKEMEKLRIVSKRSVHSVLNERTILESLKHPFIVNMVYAFQDRDNLYLVMDLMSGGDLRYHISKQKFFLESHAKFFVACIICGLEYIHENGILHRDIKPENLVFDNKGYLKITDFGIARVWSPENSKDTSGTPGYMAPEVMCRQNHGIAVDYFALGVILYEIMMGRRPYLGKDRKEIRDQILSRQAKIKQNNMPVGWSFEAIDFVNQLLQRRVSNRLGSEGAKEVKKHPWLSDFNWDSLYIGALTSPFIPKNEDNFDPRVNGEWKDEIDLSISTENYQSLFGDYFYDQTILSKEFNKLI
jgi:protein kinase A